MIEPYFNTNIILIEFMAMAISDDYLSLANAKDKAKKKSNRTKNPVDFFIYKNIRNEANTLSYNLKKDYIASSMEENQHNVKNCGGF